MLPNHQATDVRTFVLAIAVLAAFDAAPLLAANLFETGAGAQGSAGVYLGDTSWFMHRFEITQATELETIGGNFQSFFSSPISLFGAVVSLTSSSDYPNANNLSTADLLGTTLLTVPHTGVNGQDVSAPLSLSLNPGWYAMVFGSDGFGAGSAPEFEVGMPEFSIDNAPAQDPVSLFQPDHPTLPNAKIIQLLSPRFFATAAPPGPQTATLTPYVDALASLNSGSFVVTDGESSIGTQYLPIAGVDRRGIVEYDLSQIPRGSTISSASLELNVSSITFNGLGEYPSPRIYSYTGDGNATPADATQTASLLLETIPITLLGIHTFDLDPVFFQTQVNLESYAGLLIRGSENGQQMQFRTSEFAASPPRLALTFTPPPEPLPPLGDYNGNGYPDPADYTVWRNTLHSTSDLRADGDNDGTVGQSDYSVWKQAFLNAPPIDLQNGDFATGDLTNWKKVTTANADISAGFPRVESFDVDGDGQSSPAMRIRVGQVTFDAANPAGGGIEQKFRLTTAGDYSLSAIFASTNLDITGNTAPGRYELIFDGVLVDFENLNGTVISPGQVIRGGLNAILGNVNSGIHTVRILYLRPGTNTRAIYGFVDNISLTLAAGSASVVPEPSTLSLAFLTVVVLLAFPSIGAARKDAIRRLSSRLTILQFLPLRFNAWI